MGRRGHYEAARLRHHRGAPHWQRTGGGRVPGGSQADDTVKRRSARQAPGVSRELYLLQHSHLTAASGSPATAALQASVRLRLTPPTLFAGDQLTLQDPPALQSTALLTHHPITDTITILHFGCSQLLSHSGRLASEPSSPSGTPSYQPGQYTYRSYQGDQIRQAPRSDKGECGRLVVARRVNDRHDRWTKPAVRGSGGGLKYTMIQPERYHSVSGLWPHDTHQTTPLQLTL